MTMGLDDSDDIYPFAFGFAPKENVGTWFLEKLQLEIGAMNDFLLIMDRGKSIGPVVKEVYPNVPHVNHYFHLKNNLGNLCKGRSYMRDML